VVSTAATDTSNIVFPSPAGIGLDLSLAVTNPANNPVTALGVQLCPPPGTLPGEPPPTRPFFVIDNRISISATPEDLVYVAALLNDSISYRYRGFYQRTSDAKPGKSFRMFPGWRL
jgi:hypothetical protein